MYKTLEDFVGNTPLVKLKRIPGATSNAILAKLEGNNPAGSVKDRPALSMIRRAQERGTIKPGDTLIEPTSGNAAIALAFSCVGILIEAALASQDQPQPKVRQLGLGIVPQHGAPNRLGIRGTPKAALLP